MGDVKPKRKYTRRQPVAEPVVVDDVDKAVDEPVDEPVAQPVTTRRGAEKATSPQTFEVSEPLPKPTALSVNEVRGLVAEAIEAHDMQDQRIRYDTMGRKWSFMPGQDDGHAVFVLSCSVPALFVERIMGNNKFGLDGTGAQIEALILELDKAVS